MQANNRTNGLHFKKELTFKSSFAKRPEVRSVLKLLVCALSAWVLCVASRHAAAAACMDISTDKVIGLANDLVQIEFDKSSGGMVSLKNVAAKDEYLKTIGGEGNPFRVYVNTTELPWFLKTDHVSAVPGALGGKLIDPANCRLLKSSYEHKHAAGILRITSLHADPSVTFDLEVTLPDADMAVLFALTVHNSGETDYNVITATPVLQRVVSRR